MVKDDKYIIEIRDCLAINFFQIFMKRKYVMRQYISFYHKHLICQDLLMGP